LDKLSQVDLEKLLSEVKRRDFRFQFNYVLIFLTVFAIFDLFPTISPGLKWGCAGGFLIFIVSTGYGALARFRRLALSSDLFNSVMIGFASIVAGYLAFVFLFAVLWRSGSGIELVITFSTG
jgi:hypothetical protein